MSEPVGTSRGESERRGIDVEIIPAGGRWAVREIGARRARTTCSTRTEAILAAQAITCTAGGRIAVHEPSGSMQESFTLGRLAFEKISAVEGIGLDRDMEQDLREARARYASPEEARRVIASKYGASKA